MTGRVVLDASAAVRAVLALEGAEEVVGTLERATVVLAPDLYLAEVANALWKYVRADQMDVECALEHYETAASLVDRVCASGGLCHEAICEAARFGQPVYDMLYAVLARRFGCAVCTADRKLASTLGEMGVPLLCPVA